MIGGLITIASIFALAIITVIIIDEKDGEGFAKYGVVLGCAIVFIISIMVMSITKKDSYKQGQVDAFTGKVKYHLETQPDSTKLWVEIDKNDNND